MRLVEIQFEDRFAPTPEQLHELQMAWVYGSEFKVDDKGDLPYWSTFLVDIEKMPVVPYKVRRLVLNTAAPPLGLDTDTAARVPAINQKVNVTVPGLGLLLLNEVQAATDICTDALNDMLKEGWRIVAVCPQPDQRRPDYVLGRVKQAEA
jgi:hypothetical protein